jgi:hypothetical protein
MLINFIFIFILFLLFKSFGCFFQKYLINSEHYKEYSLFETLFFGIFFLTILSVFFNFFFNLHNKFYIIILLVIFIYSLIFFRNLIKKDIKNILLFSVILSPLSTYMNFGYDSGLYHIPYQLILQNEQINFGTANLHMRYGLTTSYSYIAALLWQNNFFNIVSSFSTVLFSLFFIFIIEKLKNKNSIDSIFALSALITFPIWYRYAEVSTSLVDIFFSIFFYFTFYYGIKIIFYEKKYNKKLKTNIHLFLIFLSYTISAKPTAIFLVLYLLFVFIAKYRIFLQNFFNILQNNIFSLIFVTLWVLRNLIITSCFFYPVKASCLNFSWQTNSLDNVVESITTWNVYIFNSFIQHLYDYQLIIISLLLILILIIFNLKKIFNIFLMKRNSFFFIFYFVLIILTFYIQPLKLITYLIQSNQVSLLNVIYIKEIFSFFLFYIIAISFIILSSKKIVIVNKFKNISFLNLSPFLFFIISTIIWLIVSPNPRLGQNLFLIMIPSFFILLIDFKSFVIFDYSKYFRIFILIILFKISIIQNYDQINLQSLFFSKQVAPVIKLKKRESFGYYPQGLGGLCWTEKYCYPYNNVIIYKKILNYKFFKEVKN